MFYFFKLRFVGERNLTVNLTVLEGFRHPLSNISEKPEHIYKSANIELEHRYYSQAQWNCK